MSRYNRFRPHPRAPAGCGGFNLAMLASVLDNLAPGEVLVSPGGFDVTIMGVHDDGLYVDILRPGVGTDIRDCVIRMVGVGYTPA